MKRQRYLVTGGAGFVGSHMVLALAERGHDVVVFDNLRTGHRAAVADGVRFIKGDLADAAAVNEALSDGPWDAVFHFASLSLVGESMREPFTYLIENGFNGIRLIEACVRHCVPRFILSSTAALFGDVKDATIDEGAVISPGSPYGESKLMLERALYWADQIHGLRSGCLRYFNAAGSDPKGRLGEDHRPESHVIPLAIDSALGRRGSFLVYGDDYDTPDGTCLRDYIHVSDLADAHLRVLGQLDERGSRHYNLGCGSGHSVYDVVRAVEAATGLTVPMERAPRRAGDPTRLVAQSDRLRRETGWAPKHGDLIEIVRTAAEWRMKHPDGYLD